MPINIDNIFVQTFESNIRHEAQQNDTRLRSFVTEVNKQSEKHNWETLDASDARAKTGPRMVSPAGGNGSGAVGSTDGLVYGRRTTVTETWDAGEVIEQEDPIQMIVDPQSAATKNLGMSMRRAADDIIIKAATADALNGDGTTTAFKASQTVNTDYLSVITLDTILEVDEIFNKNDVDPDEQRVFVYGPTQKRKLMQLMEVTSGDFQASKALASGQLPDWMGFKWVMSNRLLHPTAPGTDIDCLAFTAKGMGLHVSKDITAKVGERSDMSFAWQLYCHMSMASVRVEDKRVVRIKLKDSLS